MPQLQLYAFGPPRLDHDRAPVAIGRRKAVALLVYLATTRQPHSRDTLATLFWPDYGQAQARAALRRDLAALNQAISGEWIRADRATIGLKDTVGATFWCDITQFRHQLAACQTHGHRLDAVCPACLSPLAEAVSLYRADFLDGFTLRDSPTFDDWQAAQTEQLQRELAIALERLVRGHCAQGEVEPAVHYAQRWLALDPWHEPAHRRLMQVYAWAGQPAAALRQYDACVQILATEFGVTPSEETSKLFAAIKAKQFVPPLWMAQAHLPPGPLSALADEVQRKPQQPLFVAREHELHQLDNLLDLALSGQGRVVFVVGEAGSGKTALVQAFSQRAQAARPALIVAGGTCHTLAGVGDPYLPFREILALLTGDVEARWAASASDQTQIHNLWSLLPQSVQALTEHGPHLIDTLVPAAPLIQRAERAAPGGERWLVHLKQLVASQRTGRDSSPLQQRDLFAQVTNVLLTLAQQKPLLLVLDDLQWADVGSIHLLFHLGRRLAGSRILILGIYRPHDVTLGRPQTGASFDGAETLSARERHPLELVVHEFQRTFGAIHIDLNRIEGRSFVQALVNAEPHQLSAGFLEMLYQHAGGHALFTVEMLQAMRERRDLIQNERGQWIEGPTLDWETLPARIEGVIAERIGRLPPALQETLKIASVEGEFFTAEVIAQVQTVAELTLIRHLSTLVDQQHHLVDIQDIRRMGNQRLSRYRFRHHLFQKYLYNQLDDVARAYLHEAVGHALEQRYGEQVAEVAVPLARHFQAAGLAPKAVSYLQIAGDAAARVYANAEAAAYYRRALELAQQEMPGAPPKARPTSDLILLYTRLGRVLELDSQFEQALATYADMERLARQRGDHAMQLASLMARLPLYAVQTAVSDLTSACDLGEQALALARTLNDRAAEVKILRSLATSYSYLMQLPTAIDYGEQSLALARELALPEQIAATLTDLALFCYTAVGRYTEAKSMFHEAALIWRELDNLPMLANNLSSLSVCYLWLGEYGQAIAASAEALAISQRLKNLWGQAYSQYKIGCAYWEFGDPDRAIEVMKCAIQLSEQAGFITPQVITRTDLAAIYGELGAVDQGIATVQLALAAVRGFGREYALATLAGLQVRRNCFAEAQTAIDERKSTHPQEAFPARFAGTDHFAEVELAHRQGDEARALLLIERLLADLRRFGIRPRIPRALHWQAQILLAMGEQATARECLQEARHEAEAIGSRWMLWQILLTLAQSEVDPVEAGRLGRQVQEIVTSIVEHISEPELRTSFLNLPSVQTALRLPVC